MSDPILVADLAHSPVRPDQEALIAAARADERAKVFAEYCAVLCEECGKGIGVHVGEDDVFYHGEGLSCTRCGATPLRRHEARRAAV